MKRTQLYMWMYMHVSSLAVRCDVRRTHSDNDVSKGAVLDYRVRGHSFITYAVKGVGRGKRHAYANVLLS